MEEIPNGQKSDLKAMASEILQDSAFNHIETWLSTATKNEIKGLKVVFAIVKHEGKKRFRPRAALNDSLLQNSADQLRKKYMRSYYKSEYCGVNPLNQETDILKYKRINELKCSEVLKPLSLQAIERWLSLKDGTSFQSLMLTFLRGIYSVVKTQMAVPSTSHRENYSWVKQSEIKRNTPAAQSVNRDSQAAVSISKRTESMDTRTRPIEKNTSFSPLSHKLRNQQGLKGNGEITSWISHIPNAHTSLYQDSYIPMYVPRDNATKADFHTSIVFRLLPHNE